MTKHTTGTRKEWIAARLEVLAALAPSSPGRQEQLRFWIDKQAFELEKMLLHNFRAESGAPANRRGRRPGKRKSREERDGLRIEMAGAARVYETRKAAV